MWAYPCAGLRRHPEVPLLALAALVYLRIPLLFLVYGGAGCRDQGVMDARGLFHGYAVGLEVGLKHLKDCCPDRAFPAGAGTPELWSDDGSGR
jgi:hypothetical protein